jgi:hypothetical protein
MKPPLMPPNSEPRPTPPSSDKHDTPIIAMESISQRERILRQKERPTRLARSTARWAVKLMPVFLVLLLVWLLLSLFGSS